MKERYWVGFAWVLTTATLVVGAIQTEMTDGRSGVAQAKSPASAPAGSLNSGNRGSQTPAGTLNPAGNVNPAGTLNMNATTPGANPGGVPGAIATPGISSAHARPSGATPTATVSPTSPNSTPGAANSYGQPGR